MMKNLRFRVPAETKVINGDGDLENHGFTDAYPAGYILVPCLSRLPSNTQLAVNPLGRISLGAP